ncbi:hypothetical protein [Streptomyces resistomycificus]|uniref:Uncharacterized protein n=1 Tax=Streptomyces resistomycificus TaxID=67356 RepID=A0A0L8L3E0_9ACTN|nr:hypothetical protein [Streptomyces resistomycificus]KOG32609.1 hypothetical protein ADK37_26430 [Streptomyces resistomycificus]KUN90546.1 hypothetical protein AQJ84_39525 [Streptomyces resistomycificus]
MHSDDPKLAAQHIAPLVRPSDVLLAVGPAYDGRDPCAPPQLVLLGPGRPPRGVTATTGAMRWGTYSVGGNAPIRLGFWTSGELSAIAGQVERLELAAHLPAVQAQPPHLDIQTRKLLHDLRRGEVLAGASQAQIWHERLRLDQLHHYLTAIHLQRFAARRRHLLGLLEHGDTEDAAWMLTACAGELLAALLATVGETNPRRHWHPRLLRLNQETIGAHHTARVLALLRTPCAAGGAGAIHDALHDADLLHTHILHRRTAPAGPSARYDTVA